MKILYYPPQKIAARGAMTSRTVVAYTEWQPRSEGIRSGDKQYNTVPLCETLNILGPAEIKTRLF